MMKKVLQLLLLSPIILAFQCEDDITTPAFAYNDFKATITSEASISLNDVVWIDGNVSANIFDVSVNDSIFNPEPQSDTFSIHKFISPTELTNCIDAKDQFEIIIDKGTSPSDSGGCENALFTIESELDPNGLSYSYRVGLKPLTTGDYIINWNKETLQNQNRNQTIPENYPIENHPEQIGFDTCGNVSWLFYKESQREYYIHVE